MKSFSDNIIFWDTEFSSLNPYQGEILSVGMVKPTGEELYLEVEADESTLDPWVKENVIPYLSGKKVSREEAVKQMFAFMGTSRPYMVAFVNFFDVIYLYKLMGLKGGTKDFPFHWIHLDFASMLFGLGIDPEIFRNSHPNNLAKQLGLDMSKYKHHFALDDAKQLKDIYIALTNQSKNGIIN
jgi:DNA polymerase III epsilon subunit-like protein